MMSNDYTLLQSGAKQKLVSATAPRMCIGHDVVKNHTGFKWQICVFAFLLLCGISLQTYAQNRTVKGTVTASDDGSALPGVNVVVKGTSTGTTTDANGGYTLSVPGDDATLVFSFIGYTTQEVAIGSRSTIDLQLSPDIQSLQEVVVTGYTTENRREVTGAVATVKARELVAVPSGNVEQQLQGRVPGVTVITNGQPGTTSVVRLRGFGAFGGNEPLYVVDGVPVGSTDFLQPDDIETTTVLKDAPSASIYGARAANGVIVYTTKKGTKDGKLHVSYDGLFGVTVPGKVENILNPQEQADWIWQAKRNTALQLGLAPGTKDYNDLFQTDQYGNSLDGPVLPDYLMVGSNFGVVGGIDLAAERLKYNTDPSRGSLYLVMPANKAGTNWWDELTRVAPLNRHTLSFYGGTERSNYYASFGMQDQSGIIIHQKFKRYTFRINSEHQVLKRLKIGQNLQATYLSRLGLIGDSGGQGIAGEESVVLSAFRMPAIIPVYDAFGGYAGTAAKGFNNPTNPIAARERQKDNGGYSISGFGNVYAELEVIDGLNLRSSFGGAIGAGYYNYYNRPSYENSENNTTFTYGEGASASTSWIFTNTANYKKQFGIHKIDLLAGVEALNTFSGRNLEGTGQNPFTTDNNYITLTNTVNRNVGSGYGRGVNFYSLFGRAQYNFNDKYIINGVLRRDGSSRFGAANRFGVFPAVSAAWRISAEDFMAGVPFITDLKIRGGYGQMGNSNNVDPYNQFSLFASSRQQAYYDIGGSNGTPVEGFFRSRLGNPLAKWETAITSNIGFDGSFFDGKLDIVFDIWRKDTKDLLYQLPTPAVVGPVAQDPSVNVGRMRNEGIDVQITSKGEITPGLTYEVAVTGGFLHNEIVKLSETIPYFDAGGTRIGNAIRNQVGRPMSAFFGYKVMGLFQNEEEVQNSPAQDGKGVGRFRYEDVNGDGAITPDDRTYLGSPVPKFNGGINLILGYQNFELTAFMATFLGVKNLNFSRWFTDFYPSFTGAAYGNRVKESFVPQSLGGNGGNTVPIFENVSNISTNNAINSYYVENGNYARLTNLQLAYKLPESLLSRYGIERARVYVQATNLFTISKYSGLDPGVAGAADTSLGIDVGNAPVTRGFNVGLNFGF